jgi:hypothetical protein
VIATAIRWQVTFYATAKHDEARIVSGARGGGKQRKRRVHRRVELRFPFDARGH